VLNGYALGETDIQGEPPSQTLPDSRQPFGSVDHWRYDNAMLMLRHRVFVGGVRHNALPKWRGLF